MTKLNTEEALHYLAVAAPYLFGILLATVVILNLAAWALYRRQVRLHRTLQTAMDGLKDRDQGVHSALAEAKALLDEIDAQIAAANDKSADGLSSEELADVEAHRKELDILRDRTIKAIVAGEKNVAKFDIYAPQVEQMNDEFERVREKLRSSRGWEFLIFRLISRWQEYFGNQAPASSARKMPQEERLND